MNDGDGVASLVDVGEPVGDSGIDVYLMTSHTSTKKFLQVTHGEHEVSATFKLSKRNHKHLILYISNNRGDI